MKTMKVLIVARTRMKGTSRCIGGLAEDGSSVRLLRSTGQYFDTNAPFKVGQLWELRSYRKPENLVPPHVEDVLVTAQEHIHDEPDPRAYILKRVAPWRGGINEIFGGLVGYTSRGNGYVCKRIGLPGRSTGFWIPDRDLNLREDGEHYDYGDDGPPRGLKYVGEPDPPASIPAGTLVRVSLARWWKPEDAGPDLEERCYLQLSGWFRACP
ncbi:hypothetical protein D6833_10185 [Candidatus Parcubacteria bacterium]|nr:MAG: hypothetical protein D6833_10185 [Candidatus Parcubacteria bacterium]